MISKLRKYTENTREIRALSTPSLSSIDSPGEYEIVLKNNFRKIGKLAEENRGLLEDILKVSEQNNYNIDEKDLYGIISLFFDFVNDEDVVNLDLPISNRISSFLWDNILESIGADMSVLIAHMHATSCYLMMKYTYRTYPFSEECETFCEKGKAACDYLLSFLEEDKWNSLKEETSKKLILKRVSYKSSFFIDKDVDFKCNSERLEILNRAKDIESTPLYHDALTEEEWFVYKIRVRESMGALLESDNIRGFSHAQCCEIKENLRELMDLWKDNPELCMESTSYGLDLLYYYRARYFTGEIPGTEYKAKLLEIYRARSSKKFTKADVIINLLLPVEYVKHMKKRRLMESDVAVLEQFYRNAINYVFQCPNLGSIIYVLDYLLQLLLHFEEVPGGTTFEEVGLECLAALHPPTYVHSKMVANITRCLCKHMLRMHPEEFATMVGSDDPQTILSFRGEILDFAYHGALCHDFGKIAIMDTVFVYGRKISGLEFGQIKTHPQIGAKLLSQNASTFKYQNVAKDHHKWYDGTNGYPPENERNKRKESIINDIVTCADCMDAATDNAGRSYSKGITLDEYIEEIKEQAGTRYAPYLPELLTDSEVRKDLDYLLTEVRQVLYRDTFVMLRRLQRLGDVNAGIFGALDV